MARIKCFLLEPTGRVQVKLRRYRNTSADPETHCPFNGNDGYHDASMVIGEEPEELSEEGYIQNGLKPVPHDDPRWPTQCQCGYAFQESDEWQRFVEEIYQRADTGEEMVIRDAPAGAMWYTPWLDKFQVPQGKHCLAVKTPGGEWIVDSQASNCSMKDDVKQEKHHCWILHGDPPNVTADKQGGPTCSAGAGSIQCGSYHGFLRNGWLED